MWCPLFGAGSWQSCHSTLSLTCNHVCVIQTFVSQWWNFSQRLTRGLKNKSLLGHVFVTHLVRIVGRDSSVGIATCYGLDGPGIESRWRRDFSTPVPIEPEAHTASCTMCIGPFPGGESGRSVAPRLKKEQNCTSTPPMGLRGLFQVDLYLYLLLGSSLFRVIVVLIEIRHGFPVCPYEYRSSA